MANLDANSLLCESTPTALTRSRRAANVITLDTYSHAIPAMQETAAELVASLVFTEASW